jgi:hypothetical protein
VTSKDDDRVPVCLGGDNGNPLNHWAQPRSSAREKDQLEAWVCRAVCDEHSMALRDAQAMFLGDWREAYRQVFRARSIKETQGGLTPAGQVRFGFAGKGQWATLGTRSGPSSAGREGVVPIEPQLVAEVKFFGRHKGGALRDGVLLAIDEVPAARVAADR